MDHESPQIAPVTIIFVSLFEYREAKFNLIPEYRESFKQIFRFFRKNPFWSLYIFESSKVADQKALISYISKRIEEIRDDSLIIFYFLGRAQTLNRKGSAIPYLGLYGFLPGKEKGSINVSELTNISTENDKVLFLIHSNSKLNDGMVTSSAEKIVYVNDTFNNVLFLERYISSFEKVIRKAQDSLEAYSVSSFFGEFKEFLEFDGFEDILDLGKLPNHILLPNSPDLLLQEEHYLYVIDNIYNPSQGSREDGFYELRSIYQAPKTPSQRDFAYNRLQYLRETEVDTGFLRKISNVLANQKEFKTLHDLSNAKEREKILRDVDLPEIPPMVFCDSGEFIMGSNDLAEFSKEEFPEHIVSLNSYEISKFPITVFQYFLYLSKSEQDSKIPVNWKDLDWVLSHLDHPVTEVSYFDAREYCNWLSKYSRVSLSDSQRFRLPTEAEWERACRGKNGKKYPWGNSFANLRANIKSTGSLKTSSVNTLTSLSNNCEDMIGNVWEWTSSKWGSSPNASSYRYPFKSFSSEIKESDYLVVRGGGFYYDDECANCITRNRFHPNTTHSGGGFRIVLSDDRDKN